MASTVAAWPTVALGKMLKRVERFEPRDDSASYTFAGTYSFARGIFVSGSKSGLDFKLPKVQRIQAGDFVYCKIMAWEGAFGLVPEVADDCVMSGAFVVYEIDRTVLEPAYLDYYFKVPAIWQSVGRQSTGTNVRRQSLDPSVFEAASIPLPPLDEQRRIVARIEALAARIAEARGLRQAAMAEADALLDSARASIFQSLIVLGATRLNAVADLQRGKFSYRPRNDPRFFGGAHPWIQIAEIESSRKYIRQWTQTLNDEGLAISHKFPAGTILISIAATIGAVGILDFDCCVPDSIVGVTPKLGQDSLFLYHYLGYLRRHLEQLAPQSAQKNINLEILAPLPAPLLPFEEQKSIAAYLDEVESTAVELTYQQTEAAAELDALLPSLLDKAFRGEL